MKISASRQVSDWLQSLPPETRGRVRAALRRLADGKPVDVKTLQGELDGFCRLSVGEWRIVYRHRPGNIATLEYADSRSVVYEVFTRLLRLGEID